MKRLLLLSIISLFSSYLIAQSYVPELNNPKIKVQPKVNINAYAFNLSDVRLLDGSPFKNAMEKDAAYLLVLEPDRLLHRFHKNANLPTKGEIYGGWESEGVSGQGLGHYLSACAMFYANTGNIEFKKRVDYITTELEKCQIARKTGYVGAIPNEDTLFAKVSRGEIKSGGFDLNGGWSPWYVVHKVMAGLVDAYLYCDNDKALKIVTGMADWTENTIKNLTEEQRLKMLMCEYGGMNDVIANIYSITGNKKYLDLSYKFYDEFVMGQLAKKINPMNGKHSNTNVPKAIGSARQYELSNLESDKTIASFFWDIMVHHHTYVIGGNSNYEYCGEPDKLNDHLSDNTCETCNTYNMLKLTRHLFAWNPNNELADFYERALYNHILASQNPTDGMMCYFVPLRMGTKKQFSDQFNTFTCCVGSGMENHSKHVEGIYNETKDGNLFVNLFIPSELTWKKHNATIKLETKFPMDEKVNLSVSIKNTKEFTISIREPKWVNKKVQIKVNGKAIEVKSNPIGYIDIKRKWKNSDRIEITLPMALHTESMPDNANRIAFLYGPVVLAGQLGDSIPDPVFGTPVLLTDNKNINDWLKPIKDEPLTFKMVGIGKPFDAILKPFYSTYDKYYSVYFDYFTNADWDARKVEYEAEKKRQQAIEEQTIDNFRIGEMQPERDHNLTSSEQSYVDEALGRTGREARRGNYFSFEMKVQPEIPNSLLLTYIGDDKERKFDILVDGVKIAYVEWAGGSTGKFYDQEYLIPSELLKDKTKITIRIEANYGKTAGRIFGCRILKTRTNQ
ncbi:MAG: beta-L-arabinofuranosidase domain-containing protein [Tenuifilaceae bacterium]